ncbi:acyl-CoA thioesterase [Sphingomonas sp. UYAg733]
MARPEPWRLDPASYPHSEAIQTRFQDLDVLGHINNVAMAALFESGRVRFNKAMDLSGWHGHRWLVAKVEINYLAEGHFPGDVEIATGVGEIGTRSWHLLSVAFQNGEPIATCDTVIVMSGGVDATALPVDFRAGLEAHRVRHE